MHVDTISLQNCPAIHDSRDELPKVLQGYIALSHTEGFCNLTHCASRSGVEHQILLTQTCSDDVGLSAGLKNVKVKETLAVDVFVEPVKQVCKIR